MRARRLAAYFAVCLPLSSCAVPADGDLERTQSRPPASVASLADKQPAENITNLCTPGEQVLFSCRLEDKQIASMCLGGGQLSYRESQNTRADRVQYTITSSPDWSNIHIGDVRGGGGGHETHVRFTAPTGTNYMVIEGAPGQYHDAPGGPWSGVTIVKADQTESGRSCQSTPVIALNCTDQIKNAAPKSALSLFEEEGSQFDGWFIP